VPELVRAELARPSWKGEHVALGTNTDPYQWVEGRYKLMRGIWEAMRDFANPCSVLTKSPLLLRDLDLMKEISERTDFTANLSIPTLDEKAWRDTEPHTPHPRKRIEAVAELKRAGIRTGVLIAPLIPGVNDAPHQVEPLLELLDEAGPDSIGGVALHLRGEVRDIWFDWLRERRPDLLPRYKELYERGAYMALDAVGGRRECVFAFARRNEQQAAITCVPRLVATLRPDGSDAPIGPSVWGDTRIQLPRDLTTQAFRDAFTGAVVRAEPGDEGSVLAAAAVFEHFPVALLVPDRPSSQP